MSYTIPLTQKECFLNIKFLNLKLATLYKRALKKIIGATFLSTPLTEKQSTCVRTKSLLERFMTFHLHITRRNKTLPIRQMALRVGHHFLNSFIQLAKVDLGTRIMWGPFTLRQCFKYLENLHFQTILRLCLRTFLQLYTLLKSFVCKNRLKPNKFTF